MGRPNVTPVMASNVRLRVVLYSTSQPFREVAVRVMVCSPVSAKVCSGLGHDGAVVRESVRFKK